MRGFAKTHSSATSLSFLFRRIEMDAALLPVPIPVAPRFLDRTVGSITLVFTIGTIPGI